MPGLRELLAVVFGVLLGIGLLAAPRAALQLSVFVGPTRRRRGEYGTDGSIPNHWTWTVRGLGVVSLAVAAFMAYQNYM